MKANQQRLFEEIAAALGERPERATPLSGGCVGEVYRVDLPGGPVVAKVDAAPGQGGRPEDLLVREAEMLRFLGSRTSLPVPRVLSSSPRLLLMDLLPGRVGVHGAEEHAADLLAALHDVTADAYGFPFDTAIGALPQKNPWTSSWIELFRDQRLLFMADLAAQAGRLPSSTRRRIDRLAARLHDVLEEPPRPSLVHGDVWSGNVLSDGDRVTGLLDPACCFADAEVDLAFLRLFSTVGERFFRRYEERRGLRKGFSERVVVYNLYPLLVHVRLFGGGYVAELQSSLDELPS